MNQSPIYRAHFIDWLRTLAVLLLIPFHVLRVFDADDWYVKAQQLSNPLHLILNFISLWHMPLLFFLAGCSTYFALQKRTGLDFAWERVKRLLVPLIFGTFILVPPQTWIGARFNGAYPASFWHYLSSGDFLAWNVEGAGFLSSPGGNFEGGFGVAHLWFILFLLIISLITLPLTLWGTRAGGVTTAQRVSRLIARPISWILAVIVLFVCYGVAAIVDQPFIFYLGFLLLGWVSTADPRFVRAAEQLRGPAMTAGVVLSICWVFANELGDGFAETTLGLAGVGLLAMAAVWLMLVGLIGFGKRHLDRSSRTERYFGEASYPLYILHQMIIVILAFYIVRLTTATVLQGILLFVSSVFCIFALYEIVRRVGPLRFLLGMKARRQPTVFAASDSADTDLHRDEQAASPSGPQGAPD